MLFVTLFYGRLDGSKLFRLHRPPQQRPGANALGPAIDVKTLYQPRRAGAWLAMRVLRDSLTVWTPFVTTRAEATGFAK